jgi:hypothetical protein
MLQVYVYLYFITQQLLETEKSVVYKIPILRPKISPKISSKKSLEK